MSTRSDQDVDDDFADIYKEYTGPLGREGTSSTSKNASDNIKKKRVFGGGEEDVDEGAGRDPNAVPTDFTSREAKVWEAKSKATERNWKKRKEEEMICKICGESGHFTQGCPSTLGANRKAQDFFERVAARDPNVKALFTDKVIQKIEKDLGCKIKLEEKFLIVSGKDRLVLAKGVDTVHKIIQGASDPKGSSSSQRSRSRSPERSPIGSHFQRSESQRSYSGHPRDAPQYNQRFGRHDKNSGDRLREDTLKFPRRSPQAYGNDGARGRTSRSRSPVHSSFSSNSFGMFDPRNHNSAVYKNDGWDGERKGGDFLSGHQLEYATQPLTLDAIELEYNREVMELARIRDKEEDEENYKHREMLKELRENYMKKFSSTRASHSRQWGDFLQLDGQRRIQQRQQQVSSPGFSNYKQHQFGDVNGASVNPPYARQNVPMDSAIRYPNNSETYSSRPHGSYNDVHHQRRDDFGKTFNRY